MNPRIVIVVLFWNKPAMTARCVRSLAAAGFGRRVILIDNGSLPRHAREILETAHTEGVDARVVRLEKNSGFARGMNAGLRAAFADGADLVLALSNDTELPPSAGYGLNALAAPDRQRGGGARPAIHCPRVHHLMDRRRLSYTHGRVDPCTLALEHIAGEAPPEIAFPLYYPAAATVWSRAAFERLQGFHEAFYCYWEDVELSLRASRSGVALRAAPDVLVHHLGRGTTGGKPAMAAEFERGRERFRKLMDTGTLSFSGTTRAGSRPAEGDGTRR